MSKLKLMTILGTRPEIIRLSAVMRCADRYFDHVVVHTGQNYDYNVNEVFFKDLKIADNQPHFAEIGQGNLEWDEIISACEEAGVEYALVEQDSCDGDPFDSLKISYDFLKEKGFCYAMKNICIIGYGAIGPVHAAAIEKVENARLYAVCDNNPKKIEKCKQKYDVVEYKDIDEMLCDVNIHSVHICLPYYLHFEVIKKALAKGKEVVVEKPVTMTKAEFDELLTLKNADLRNIKNLNMRCRK